MSALITTVWLCSGCVSASLPGIFALSSSGGTASADSTGIKKPQSAPVTLIPGSHYSAFTEIDPESWPQHRDAAAAQKHRTPRAQPPPHDFLIKPVASGKLTSLHGYRINPLSRKTKKHNGIDYAAPHGTEVYAAGTGVVERLYHSKSYGNYLRIRHADGYATAYAHLNFFANGIKVGTKVKQGQIIGAVGSTGLSTGPHLHFELIYKGRFVDPLGHQRQTELANSDSNSAISTLAQK